MSVDPFTTMPATISAGTTVKLLRTIGDYPASEGWTYGLHIRGASVLNVTATASGDDYAVTITSTQSATLAPGGYRWVERLTLSGESYDVASGVVEVTRNLATATAGQAQTSAERTLALIEAAIEGRIPQGMESYQIGGRAVTKIPILDLEKLRGIYASKVWRQKNPGNAIGRVQVVFGGA